MIVVGLTGKAEAGKSAVADYLVEKHGFIKLSFATPLKKMLRTLDPIMGVSSGEPYCLSELFEMGDEARIKKHPVWGEEYRRLLQVLGTDCIRAVDEDFWVRAAMKRLTDLDGKYVFDDVRFPNEAEAVQYWGDVWDADPDRVATRVWRVVRPNHDGGAGAHESEQHEGSMGETLTINNAGSLNDLLAQVHLKLEQDFEQVSA